MTTALITIAILLPLIIAITVYNKFQEEKEKDRIFEKKLQRIFKRTAEEIELGQMFFKAQEEKARNEEEFGKDEISDPIVRQSN